MKVLPGLALVALVAGPISDAAVTQLGLLAVALVGAGVTLSTQRAKMQAAREGRLERRREQSEQRKAETHAETKRERDEWRERYHAEFEKRVRVEERLDRVLAQYHLPAQAGRSGEFPPYVAPERPMPPVPVHPAYRGPSDA